MGRTRTEAPEVIHRLDDAASEKIPPDPVHDDTVEESVFGSGEPVGELETSAAAHGNGRATADDLWKSPWHERPELGGLSPHPQVDVGGIFGIARCHHEVFALEFLDHFVEGFP